MVRNVILWSNKYRTLAYQKNLSSLLDVKARISFNHSTTRLTFC